MNAIVARSLRAPSVLAAAAALLGALAGSASAHAACATAAAPAPSVAVPSPDWRAQVIYEAMIDRFDDGDRSNDDQHRGEYDPADPRKFSGGDLCGLTRRLGYIRDLGATALWITPPVANQWWDGSIDYGGYHGYWAENFKQVDRHFGTLDDYRRLADGLHARGMYLVQDIVVNHVGNFFGYRGGWDAHDPTRHFAMNPDSRPHARPTQWPFSLDDARVPAERRAAIYHWTPDITDYRDPRQQHDYQLAGLDDLDTENPVVRRALRDSYDYWIRAVGVDAFRVDTAFYVPPAFFRDFLDSDDAQAPGVRRAAAATGRRDFFAFGEGFGIDRAYEDAQERRIDAYMRDAQGDLLPGMLNFPLYGSTLAVFAQGRPTAELGWRIGSMMRRFARPHLMPSFVDNHDVDRFLAAGDARGLEQALLAIMTLPGIPVIWQGTEQGFKEQRAAMFAGGYGAGGRDHFDADAPLYRYLQRAIALRRTHAVLWRGDPTVLYASAAGPGGIAWRMDDGDDRALVAFNTADAPMLLDHLDAGLPPGARLAGAFAIDGAPQDLVVGADGRVELVLPARSGMVWLRTRDVATVPASAAALSIDALPAAPVHGDLVLQGGARGVARFALVVDGDLAHAMTVTPGTDGRWQATLPTADMIDPAVEHRVVAWAEGARVASPPQRFRVERAWTTLAELDDPAGDDRGPRGRYAYPDEASWHGLHPADLRHVAVRGSGGALQVQVRLRDLIDAWNAPNGFDHVALTLFVELPRRAGGATALPLQHATLPAGMRWHYRVRASGWGVAGFGSDGTSPDSEGTPVRPAPQLHVDLAARTLTFTIPAAALGHPATLSGARLYLATWDYDGGFRPLTPAPGAGTFGGGGDGDPRVMDDTAVITLP